MKRIYTYILALLALSVACQRVDLPEELPTDQLASAVGKKARISFSTAELDGIDTRAFIDPTVDVHTLHLVIFDENGMLVEVCEAETLGSSDHDDHASGKHYTVELTLSDKPRVIHYIANCPVDQIVYGHEVSIIGNMYVDKNDRAHKTEYETSYWARIEVPFILVQETEENGKTVVSLDSRIADKFQHVPLLRNFAEITVTSTITDGSFVMEGYTVYNVIDRGTIAPYNNKTQTFQDFIYKPEGASTFASYTYPQLNGAPYYYEGHALSSAELIDELPKNADGTPKIFRSNEPFYVYERKISVMTDDESKWKESPAHIIIKGQYKPQGSNTANTYYYKMDLVYNVKDSQGVTTEIKYYNILRNFMYQFNLTGVHAAGYKTLEEAVAGSAGNNISGSASASKLTNVSDEHGRLWVSYTDTTLVTNNTISLKYKYIPNYYNASETSTYGKVQNEQVRFENIVGEVISGISVASTDITSGSWAGYRNVTITVNNLQSTTLKQALSLKTNNANLSREIRYTLRRKFNMVVECTPKVPLSMMAPVTVDIKLPLGLTEDMFPLVLNMETYDRTLSPDAGENTIPVTAGPSIIDVEGRKGQNSFYFTVTIPTIADYNGMATVGNMKVYTTYWQTNKEANASTMYVDNKYFNQGSDSWENYSKTFSEVSISPTAIPYGAGREASVSFTMPNDDNTPVTLTLTGLEDASGNKTPITVTPTAGSSSNVTVTASGTDKVVKVTGLYTSTISDQVTVHIDADGYKDEKVTASRQSNQFVVTGFDPSMITGSGDFRNLPVTYTFTVPTYYDNMEVNVTLDGLAPADDETSLSEVNGRSAIKTYTFKPGAAGTYVLKLKTINKDACTCSLTLEAEKYYYETVTSTIEQTAAKYAFQSLTVPESVRYGAGRNVSITFVLDADDNNFKNKDVKVTLVGMTRNGETSFTYNTRNVGIDRKVTINNLVTTSDGDNLRVTVEAAEYLPETAIISQRTLGAFKDVKFNKTKVGSKVGEVVELSFTVDKDSYYPGMIVNLNLDRLEPVDGNYTYSPAKEGTYTINLRTTQASEGDCSAKLTAAGMAVSQVATVNQTARTAVPVFNSDFSNNNDRTFDLWNANNASMSINDGRLRVHINQKGTNVYEPQLVHNCGDNSFVDGRVYYLKFTLSGNNTGNAADNLIYAKMQDNTSNYREALAFDPIEVTNTERIVTVEGVCNGTGNYLVIHVGWFKGDLYIDNFEFGYYD